MKKETAEHPGMKRPLRQRNVALRMETYSKLNALRFYLERENGQESLTMGDVVERLLENYFASHPDTGCFVEKNA